jgi:hypothetical protein
MAITKNNTRMLDGSIDITTQVTGYQTGTYTTTITPQTSGTISLHTGKNNSFYTKVGNLVHVTGELWVSSTSSPQGGVAISLPFTVVNNIYQLGTGSVMCHGVTYQSNQKGSFLVKPNINTTVATMFYNTTSSMLSLQAQNAGLANNSQIIFTLTYFTA